MNTKEQMSNRQRYEASQPTQATTAKWIEQAIVTCAIEPERVKQKVVNDITINAVCKNAIVYFDMTLPNKVVAKYEIDLNGFEKNPGDGFEKAFNEALLVEFVDYASRCARKVTSALYCKKVHELM